MSRPEIDVEALASALDQRRQAEAMSWRGLAESLDLSPSTLTRLRNQHVPETSALLSLTQWLGMSIEDFVLDNVEDTDRTDLPSQLAPLLRARHDLDTQDVEMLEEIIAATYRQIRRRKESV